MFKGARRVSVGAGPERRRVRRTPERDRRAVLSHSRVYVALFSDDDDGVGRMSRSRKNKQDTAGRTRTAVDIVFGYTDTAVRVVHEIVDTRPYGEMEVASTTYEIHIGCNDVG